MYSVLLGKNEFFPFLIHEIGCSLCVSSCSIWVSAVGGTMKSQGGEKLFRIDSSGERERAWMESNSCSLY